MARHNETGKQGEDSAVDFLLKKGHSILARNYRFGKAEIDIISIEKETIVFTEVKTRSTGYFGFPEESISAKKMELLREAAEEYMEKNKISLPVRFDVISIVNQNGAMEIFHITDAFGGDEMNFE